MPKSPGMQFIAPAEMLVQPTPLDFAVASAKTPGGKQIVLQVMSPTGVNLFFLTEDMAKQLGKALDSAAGAGIVVVPAGTVVR